MVARPGRPVVGGTADGGAPQSLLSAHPHLAVAAITPFGLDGPWRDRPATEFTLQAWSGGIVGLGRGAPDRAPVHVGGQVGEWLSGAYTAVGIQAALARARQTGAGQLIDLSMLEVAVLCLTYYPVTFFETLHRPWRTERSLFQPGVAAAKDGLVALGCGTAQQWFDLCAMVGHPEWIDPAAPVRIGELTQRYAPQLRELGRRPHGRGHQGPGHGLPHTQRAGQQRRDRHRACAHAGAEGIRAQPDGGVPAASRAVPAHPRRAAPGAACPADRRAQRHLAGHRRRGDGRIHAGPLPVASCRTPACGCST